LVLASRTLETAASWAGIPKRDLVPDYLVGARCFEILADDLARAGTAAVRTLPGAHGRTASAAEREEFIQVSGEIVVHHRGGRSTSRPLAALHRLDWLATHHPADTEIGAFLAELQSRLSGGAALMAWLDAQRDGLLAVNSRAIRTRNAIVHGGPLIAEVAASAVDETDRLAQLALDWATDALANEQSVSGLFQERKTRFDAASARLRAESTRPVDELADLLSPT
jgi:hypothetical protein